MYNSITLTFPLTLRSASKICSLVSVVVPLRCNDDGPFDCWLANPLDTVGDLIACIGDESLVAPIGFVAPGPNFLTGGTGCDGGDGLLVAVSPVTPLTAVIPAKCFCWNFFCQIHNNVLIYMFYWFNPSSRVSCPTYVIIYRLYYIVGSSLIEMFKKIKTPWNLYTDADWPHRGTGRVPGGPMESKRPFE